MSRFQILDHFLALGADLVLGVTVPAHLFPSARISHAVQVAVHQRDEAVNVHTQGHIPDPGLGHTPVPDDTRGILDQEVVLTHLIRGGKEGGIAEEGLGVGLLCLTERGTKEIG